MQKKLVLSIIALLCCSAGIYAQAFKQASQISGSGSAVVQDLCVDNAGNVISIGGFTSTIDFDPGSGTTNKTSQDDLDLFLQKYDNSGNLVWVHTIGSAAAGVQRDEVGLDVVTDASNNIYIIGVHMDDVDIDPGSGTTTLAGAGFFVAKYDANGDFVWGQSLQPSGPISGAGFLDASIDIDRSGNNIYVAYNYSINGTGAIIFVDKITTAGSQVWKYQVGTYGNGYMGYPSVAVDGVDNVYLSGTYGGTAKFDINSATVYNGSNASTFLVKINSSGNFVYQREVFGGNECYDMTVDNNNSVLLVGSFFAVTDFDPGPGTINIFPGSQFSRSMYILKLSSIGNYIWAETFGSSGDNRSNGITTDALNNVYVTGVLEQATFSSTPYVMFQRVGSQDAYLLKLASNGSYLFAQHFSGGNIEHGECVAVDKNSSEFYVGGQYVGGIEFEANTSGSTTFTGHGAYIAKFGNCDPINLSVTATTKTLTADDASATYQWIDCSTDLPVQGATGQSYTPAATGNYAVVLTKGTCSDTSVCNFVQVVGVEDVEALQSNMYPNPASDMIHLRFAQTHQLVNIKVTTISGQLLADESYQNINAINKPIDLPNGVYYIIISADEHTTFKKLVISK